MFLMDHLTALITFIIIIILYVAVCYRKPNANWGSSTQVTEIVFRSILITNDSLKRAGRIICNSSESKSRSCQS